jgi:N6-adenosine-specific RNA methylase IME4
MQHEKKFLLVMQKITTQNLAITKENIQNWGY